MSVSAIFGTRILPSPLLGGGVNSGREAKLRLVSGGNGGGGVAVIECSSRPQKKSTAHHMKSRPKKTQAWDIRRGPAVYAPLPPLPPEWTIVSTAAEAEVSPAPSSPPPLEVE